MEVSRNKETEQLTVHLTNEEAEAIIEGSAFTNTDKSDIIEVRPLSDIDDASRAIEPKEKVRVRNALGMLTSRVSVMPNQTILYIPESLPQHRDYTLAEEVDANHISGNASLRPSGGVRIEFE